MLTNRRLSLGNIEASPCLLLSLQPGCYEQAKKLENCNYVMIPRLQRPGLKPQHVERNLFKAELKHVEFNNILGFCLGENHWCDYIEGNLSFICVIAGFNATELTPKYPDCIKERVYALYDAVYWRNEYGFDCLVSDISL